ncbi:hypothetical protein EVAR_46834_1 [Eumeta japonica]|uniref:Uncharacterized protein n=1 Tax=Eumeta variegata TaxID=151549 RepID=A0A4C2A5L8_EUMVA|nr:hypothetical protein EVAR_46834_1 [Eumeta japonica]
MEDSRYKTKFLREKMRDEQRERRTSCASPINERACPHAINKLDPKKVLKQPNDIRAYQEMLRLRSNLTATTPSTSPTE